MSDQPDKLRVRINTDGQVTHVDGISVGAGRTSDNYNNFLASVGMQTHNQSAGSTYGVRNLTRERLLLEWCYRGSWVCGIAVDAVADDMIKLGVDFSASLKPEDSETLDHAMVSFNLWGQLNELIKWGRLYGGAIGIIMIDGQDVSTPLRLETVGPGQFKGLCVMDRWMIEPSLNDLVTEPGPDLGHPRLYKVTSGVAPLGAGIAPALLGQWVHHTRCFRYTGIDLPWWQRVTENGWGMSVYERMWDRLTAFDSTTQGIAQLVYRAYLRIIKLKDLNQAAAMSPEMQRGIARRIDLMTRFQTNEGVTLLSADDDFQTVQYAFGGLNDVLIGMGQQLAGALQIPLVRLFGQAPVGMNSTGDSDWRNYYDGIHQQQEMRLRRPLTRTLICLARSEGIKLPDNFHFAFRPLWQMQPAEKGQMAATVTQTILMVHEAGLISDRRALEELRDQSRETGVWTTITEEEIEEADEELAPGPEEMAQMQAEMAGPPGEEGEDKPGAETENEPGGGGGGPPRIGLGGALGRKLGAKPAQPAQPKAAA